MAFLKCARCDQLYTSKLKLADHIVARHANDDNNGGGSVATSSSNITATTVAQQEKLMKGRKRRRKTVSPSYECFVCRKRHVISKMIIHIVERHLPQLQRLMVEAEMAKPFQTDNRRTTFKRSPSTSSSLSNDDDELDADLAYVLGQHERPQPPRYVCPCCFKEDFAYLHAFQKHLKHHILRVELSKSACDFCDKVFYTSKSLHWHIMRAHAARLFTCSTCGHMFKSFHGLRQHRIHIHAPSSSKCQNCELSFVFLTQLRQHQRSHKQLTCDYCTGTNEPVIFNSHEALVRHMFRFHSNNNNNVRFTCRKCKPCATFTTRDAYFSHKNRAHFLFQFRHFQCKSSFSSSDELAKHSVYHLKPFRCVRCSKYFRLRQSYLRHVQRSHHIVNVANLQKVHKAVKQLLKSGKAYQFYNNATTVSGDSLAFQSSPSTCQCAVKCEPV